MLKLMCDTLRGGNTSSQNLFFNRSLPQSLRPDCLRSLMCRKGGTEPTDN